MVELWICCTTKYKQQNNFCSSFQTNMEIYTLYKLDALILRKTDHALYLVDLNKMWDISPFLSLTYQNNKTSDCTSDGVRKSSHINLK